MKRWLVVALQVAVSISLIAALILVADLDALRTTASALSLQGLAFLLILTLAIQIPLIVRWRAMLAVLSVRESFARSWHVVFAGYFLNNFLPATVGFDGLRIVLLARATGAAPLAIGAIAYERLMQLVLHLALIAAAALLAASWLPTWLRASIVAAGCIGILLLVLLVSWLGARPPRVPQDKEGLLARLWRLASSSALAIGKMHHLMLRHRQPALVFWLASLLHAGLTYAVCWMVLADLGQFVSVAAIVVAGAAASIATAAPISVGGVGVYEAALVAILGLAGVPASDAVLMALIKRVALAAVSLLGAPSAHALLREARSR